MGKTNNPPEQALKRYELLLHPFMLAKQNAAGKFAASFAPKTWTGLFFRNQVTKALGIPFVAKTLMGSTLLDRIDLPDYPQTALG